MKKNNSRVDLIVALLFAIIALVIPALVAVRHFFGMDPIFFLHITWGRTAVGVVSAIVATLITLLNIWRVWLEPWLYKRQHGSFDDYHGPSGLPIIGEVFIAAAGVLLPPSMPVGIILLLLYVADPGGLLTFFYTSRGSDSVTL